MNRAEAGHSSRKAGSLAVEAEAMPNASRQVVVANARGLHARPAMEFVNTANAFASSVKVRKGGDEPMTVDGKSIMEMMTLAAEMGTPLEICAEGDDAAAVVQKLVELFESKFGEE
jgi:phosphotransferase system HPr (HPr) family protein